MKKYINECDFFGIAYRDFVCALYLFLDLQNRHDRHRDRKIINLRPIQIYYSTSEDTF